MTQGGRLQSAYRYSYHGVVGFPFCLLVETKLGRRLRRLDIADYQNTGLRIRWRRDLRKKMSTLYIQKPAECHKKNLMKTSSFFQGLAGKRACSGPCFSVCTAQLCLRLLPFIYCSLQSLTRSPAKITTAVHLRDKFNFRTVKC